MTEKPSCKRPNCPNVARTRGYCYKHAKLTQQPDPTRAECQHIIDQLHELGYTDRGMAIDTGVYHDTIFRFTSGKIDHFRRPTLDKLQALLDNPTPKFVPAWPYTRRIQALLAIGITVKEIAEACETDGRRIRAIATGEYPKVSRDLADTIRDYYETASLQPIKQPAPAYAARNWPYPAAWDDIDNPDEQPQGMPKAKNHLRRQRFTPQLQQRTQALVDYYGGVPKTGEATGLGRNRIYDFRAGTPETITVNDAARINRHYLRLPAHTPNHKDAA